MNQEIIDAAAKEAAEEYDCTQTMRGVFKACVFFYNENDHVYRRSLSFTVV